MKSKILAVLLGLCAAFAIQAQTIISGTLTALTNNVISTEGIAIISLTVTDTSGATNIVVGYDNNVATSTNIVRPAYTAAGVYSTNIITTWTNPYGVSQSLTNTQLHPYTYSVAATTNEAARVFTTMLTAAGSITLPPAGFAPLGTTRGFVIRPVGSAVYTLTYATLTPQ